jgi:hypothetical protein
MTDPDKAKADLIAHADAFLQGGLWSWAGYFPNHFHGKLGEDYYRWSKRAYDLIQKLKDDR